MKIVCDSCGTKYSISDDKVRGKVFKIRCKKCSHIIVVRGTNDAAAAPAAAEGGWHLVVDGDQVGPLPEAEIRGKLERGEISGDTYVWKEGFSDWLKLSAVPELAALTGGGVAGEAAGDASVPVSVNGDSSSGRQSSPSGLFGTVGGAAANGGSGGVAAAAGAGEDTSDVFAAPAPAAARAGGGDLFASSAPRAAAADEPRWPSSGGGGAGGVQAAAHDGGRVENLTGQRHENSVLFSLSNLQSLAMPSAAPKAAASATTAATSEGSGLIDIRAMAATTLGTPSAGGAPSFGGGGPIGGGGTSGDDLPAFAAFSPAAPVLLPLPSSSGPPKWVYPVIGLMVVLVLGIGVMAYKIITAKPPTVVTETVTVPAPAPAAPAAAPGAPSAPVAAADPAKPSTIPDENLPPREAAGAPAKAEGKSDGKSDGKHHGSSSGKRGDKKGSASDEKKGGGTAVAAAPAAAEPEVKKPAKGSLDDLLQGALSSDRPRQGTQKRDDDSGGKKPAADAPSAGPLSKSAVVSGMNAVRPKVNECYSQYKVPGMAMVNVVIGKNGKVSSATVTGKFAGTPTGSCVEKAVKSASFPPSDGLSTPYPFQLK